ncbi:DUF4097 family beta strand repeat-containing protein [Kitasatospora griseola]|uniref:DUF4097 family beta strand repeat-containing protein n=1 Tax=Kitasatospora griseola TaxID=2064 RepID=UPI0037F4DA33
MTIRTHTAPAGPAVLDLTQHTGRITIRVDHTAIQAGVTVRTVAESGPVADAVRRTEIDQVGQRITVAVPQIPGMSSSTGTTIISGGDINISGDHVTFSGLPGFNFIGGFSGRVIVDGVDVTQAVNGGAAHAEIETTVTLPPRSWVRLTTRSATTRATGPLESLDYCGTSGTLRADEVRDLTVDLTSGRATVARVTQRLTATLTSGDLGVHAYDGADARITMTSGNARLAATRASRGRLSIGLTSGNATLTGTRHLDVSRHVTSGYLSVN